MSKGKASVVCPIFVKSKYPYHGIGIKLGDPFAVTYKFYATKHFAIAVDAGSAASGLYYKYHKGKFSAYAAPDTLTADQSTRYLGHKVRHEWIAEGKLLYHYNASSWLEGLQLYGGAGWQWRKLAITYEYFLEASLSESIINTFNNETITMGPTVAFGVEYAYFEVPLSMFMEVELYADLMEDPGWARLQGGAGLRYIF